MPRFASLVVVIAVALLPAAYGFAETYPARPIRLVVALAPGGQSDIIGRVLGQALTDILKQPVVIENRAGAGDRSARRWWPVRQVTVTRCFSAERTTWP